MQILTLSVLASAVAATFASSSNAQAPSAFAAESNITHRQVDVVAQPEATANRWIVHFAKRPFDLETLAEGIRENVSAAEYALRIAAIEEEMAAHQRPFLAEIERLGGKVHKQFWIVNACSVDIDAKHLDALKELAGVSRIQPDHISAPGATPLPILTATNNQNHDVDVLQSIGIKGSGVTAAIVDTGLDEDLAGTGRPHRTFFLDGNPANTSSGGIGGSRMLTNVASGTVAADLPNCWHGTGVAGVAIGADWGTMAADDGHAPEAFVAGYSIVDPILPGFCNTSSTATAQGWQDVLADRVALNIETANMSYHQVTNEPLDIGSMAMDQAALIGDILVVTIAGNQAQSGNGSFFQSPAAVNAISVGAVVNDTHTLAPFSGFGPRRLGEVFPDMCANGVGSVMPRADNENVNYVDNGTSFAAPQVCGTATLLRSTFPAMIAEEVKAVLLASADYMPGIGLNQVNGAGCGYLKSTIAFRTAASTQKHGSATLNNSSSIYTRNIQVQAGLGCAVSVAWFRQNVTNTNWADLTIRIKDSSGATIASSTNPQRNTEEFVRFRTPVTTTYTLEITGSGIPAGGQGFGWACTCPTTP